jgi:hypothetical protein
MVRKAWALSLLAMLLLVGSAFAQNVDVWYGGTFTGTVWHDTIKGKTNSNIDVPVYFLTAPGAYVANIHLPLGVKDTYIDGIPRDLCNKNYFPFYEPLPDPTPESGPGWDDASFLVTYEGAPPNVAGYHGRSFLGFADLGGGANPWLYFTTPTQALNFKVHTVDNSSLIGQTVMAFRNGISGTLGGPAAGDTIGGPGFAIVSHFAYLLFSANSAPTIGAVSLPSNFCGHAFSEYPFCVTDADLNTITVTSNYGTIVTVTNEPGHWCGYIDFSGVVVNNVSLIINATDGTDAAAPVTIPNFSSSGMIGSIIADMNDSFPLWPGYSGWMPITLTSGSACIGGFEFTIVYDPTVLQILGVRKEAAIATGEYWFVNYHPTITPGCPAGSPSGAIKITFINDLNNQVPAQPICNLADNTPIFSIDWYVKPDYNYPSNFCIPICFYTCEPLNYRWNAVTDETGMNVWKTEGCDDTYLSTSYLNLKCGNIKVQSAGSVIRGDINHNSQAYEIGDAVLLANYLMDPATYPLDAWQLHAADINGDGVLGSISDLIMMINIVNGTIPAPGLKLDPIDVPATVAMPSNPSGSMDVTVNSTSAIGGALVRINHAGVQLGAPVATNMDVLYSDKNDVLTVVVYNGTIEAGNHTLFTVPVIGSGAMTFGDVDVSDNIGHTLNAQTKIGDALPTAFSVAQNYPNPFNVKTAISFALPTSENVTVTIYNVAGQVVQTINAGQMNAGVNSVIWDASKVGSGVYLYKVVAGEFSKTMKATLLK